jgi:hypothetical protein
MGTDDHHMKSELHSRKSGPSGLRRWWPVLLATALLGCFFIFLGRAVLSHRQQEEEYTYVLDRIIQLGGKIYPSKYDSPSGFLPESIAELFDPTEYMVELDSIDPELISLIGQVPRITRITLPNLWTVDLETMKAIASIASVQEFWWMGKQIGLQKYRKGGEFYGP